MYLTKYDIQVINISHKINISKQEMNYGTGALLNLKYPPLFNN